MGSYCCPPNGGGSFSPIMFFATSSETPTGNLVGAGSVDVLTLGVSPTSPGQHQVKLDSTVALTLNKPAGAPLRYTIVFRLKKDGVTIANWTEAKSYNVGTASTYTLISNLTWDDMIISSTTYTVEIQVLTIVPATTTVLAETRALNAIVF
ncbi:hypothetical protein CAI16_14760 [Virgibacillus dokdonensis]|uniref:Uncharacterized protein n=1 Tax=Virgibacillus dokdonensis TaxID=302167 RepID=A0A3E0WN85_9BACI|nr:hypothetical protein [Virgibacillus dokdonensis]RFA33405.1 hypothetical protein CAI16_14760 [Virgibacillus dokdonensis]